MQYIEVYTSFGYISQKSDALWSLKETHGEAKNGAAEEKAIFTILRSESSFDVFMRIVALGKSFPTHGHMRQSDERGLGKVRFKNRAES